MKKKFNFLPAIIAVIVVVAVLLVSSCTYITYENEYTVVKEFGQIKQINADPGLRFRTPFIQTVNTISKSKQFYDLPKSDVITSDKKTMIADAYIIWHVTDAKTFTKALNANFAAAEGRIDVIVYNAIKTTISNMTQEELIISRDDPIDVANADTALEDVEIKDITAVEELDGDDQTTGSAEASENSDKGTARVIAISKQILTCIGEQCDIYGLEIDDVEIKVLDLPDENKEAVYERMITERNNIAAAYKAQGESEAQIIRNTTDKEVSIMTSEAQAQADKTVAEGEAEYMRILSDAYNDPDKAEFYLYSRALDTAKKSMGKSTTLFLDKDSPLAQIFQGDLVSDKALTSASISASRAAVESAPADSQEETEE